MNKRRCVTLSALILLLALLPAPIQAQTAFTSDTILSEIPEIPPYLLNLLIVLAVVGALIFMWTER